MTGLVNNIVKEGYIPDDRRKVTCCLCRRGKVIQLCAVYTAITLLEQPMKVLERILERIRCQVSIDNMPGKGTTDAIFIKRQVQETPNKEEDVLCFCRFLWIQ